MTDEKRKPNLFDFATSELSHDAFIAWLISWADPFHKKQNKLLHLTALDFLKLIFDRNEIKFPKINEIEVKTQHMRMDVYVKINETLHLVIEDKVYSKTVNKQLDGYVKKLSDKKSIERSNILGVFYKTRDQSARQFKENSYYSLERRDILEILLKCRKAGLKNDIIDQYYEYLRSIENEVESYIRLNPVEWKNSQWRGFFKFLSKEFEDVDWSYVHNESQGFMGFWWNSKRKLDYHVYLQIEKNKLCFKVRNDNHEFVAGKTKRNWLEVVLEIAKEKNAPIVKPGKLVLLPLNSICIFSHTSS